MKKMLLAATAAFSFVAVTPAQAVSILLIPGSAASFAAPPGDATINFNAGLPLGFSLTGGGQLVSGDLFANYAEPGFSDGSQYLAVLGGQTATLSSTMGFGSASLFLGSVDLYNTIEVLAVGGAVLGTFAGAQLGFVANGDQNLGTSNNRIVFTNTASEAAIGGLRFTSSGNSLETDNVVFSSAVPEPATWAMMLIGFGAVGYSMRRRPANARFKYAV